MRTLTCMEQEPQNSVKENRIKKGGYFVLVFMLLFLPSLVSESWADHVYHPYIFIPIRNVLISLSGWTLVPLGQLLFYSFVVFSVFYLVRKLRIAIKNRTWLALIKPGKKALLLFAVIYFLFQISWGINYKRSALTQVLDLDTSQIKQQELIDLAGYFIDLNNVSVKQIQNPFTKRNLEQLKAGAMSGYRNLGKTQAYFQLPKANAKAVIAPRIMSYFGLGGIYFPFTAEAYINTHKPALSQPFTIAHELAHQMGIASEDEANFTAFLVGRNSDSLDFQFAANYTAMRYCIAYVADSAIQFGLQQKCDAALIEIMKNHKAYWEKYKGIFSQISHVVNDSFLKMNGQKEGIKSYGLFVKMLVGWWRNKG